MITNRWRLYTQDTRNTLEVNNALEQWIVSMFPNGATIFAAEGVWYGGREMSLCIEVVDFTGDLTEKEMQRIAADLRTFNDQESVLLTCDSVNAHLI